MAKIKQLARPIAKEFHKDKCGFNHMPADDFVKSQWQHRSKSVPYLLYRWIIGLFFTGVVIESIISSGPDGYYLIFLTHWGITLCMLTNLFGAILVTIYHFHPEYEDKLMNLSALTSPFKIYWALHIITLVLSIVITIVYWSILFNEADLPLTPTNVLTHALNSVCMFIDLLIVAYPIRLLHIFLPVVFGIVFTIFSVIYYAAGGVNTKGEPYIYNVLDWREPGKAMITVVGVLLLTCFVYMCIFMVYKVRVFVYRRFNSSPSVFQPTTDGTGSKDAAATGVLHSPSGISMVLGNYTSYDNQGFSTISEKVNGKH